MALSKNIDLVREALRKFNRRAGVLKSDPYGLNLSLSQSSALVDLERFGSLKPNELVKRLNLEKSSVSRLITVLKKGGFIQIGSDPQDRRAKVLTLTKAGRKAVAHINEVSNRSVLEAFEFLNASEQRELINSFSKLAAAVDRAEEHSSKISHR